MPSFFRKIHVFLQRFVKNGFLYKVLKNNELQKNNCVFCHGNVRLFAGQWLQKER